MPIVRVRVRLLGLREHVRPVEGEIESERLIVPVKPPVLVRVIVELADWPAITATEVGFAEIVKSPRAWTLTAITETRVAKDRARTTPWTGRNAIAAFVGLSNQSQLNG